MRAFTLIDAFAEDLPHGLCPRFVHIQHAAAHVVAEQVTPEHDALLHAPPLSPFDALGGAATLLLRDGGEDRQAQLGVTVERAEVVAQKQHAHTQTFELARVVNAVERVARKARDLLGHDQVERAGARTGDHALKGKPFFRARSGQPLVGEDSGEFPVRLLRDIGAKVALLALEGVRLIVAVCGDAAVGSHAQRLFPGTHVSACPSSAAQRSYSVRVSRPRASSKESTACSSSSTQAAALRSAASSGCAVQTQISGILSPPRRAYAHFQRYENRLGNILAAPAGTEAPEMFRSGATAFFDAFATV